jgi:glutaminase
MLTSPITDYLHALHARLTENRQGRVADYIPELAKVDPERFGVCIATCDGYVYEVGDTAHPFTIQSVSKPLTYGLALESRGEQEVLRRIGVEPSGDAFNAISLQPQTGAPLNPLINAGAIAACGLVPGATADERFARILAAFSRYAGRALDVDEAVYRSESETGHRNRAIAWMLRNFDILADDPMEALDAYFRQCSIRVTCRDLALMGATLANGGLNAVTGERAIPAEHVDKVLSVMATCGMYDFSGEWLYRTGLPAKSGVGGGIVAVQPGRLGIGVYSPRLDAQGNSARGIAACRELARDLGLHALDVAREPAPVIRRSANRRALSSKRRWPAEAAGTLRGEGRRLRVYQLQGTLAFWSIERVVREFVSRAESVDFFVLNLRLVQNVDRCAAGLLARTQAALATRGTRLLVSEVGPFWGELVEAGVERESFFADDDFAIEFAERALLSDRFPDREWSAPAALADCALFAGLAPAELARVDGLFARRTYRDAQTIIALGDPANELFVLTRGSVMVSVPTEESATRLDVFTPGMAFGEVAFLDRSRRSANVTALGEVECRVLDRTDFDRLGVEHPALKIRLLENMAVGLTGTLRRVTRELAALR